MTKKLVGNQSLLDKNDDGKISGEDFAELRKEKRVKASRGRKIREGLEFIIDSIKNNKFLSNEAKEELIESETILDNIKRTDFIPDAASKTDAEKTKAVTDFLQENEALDLDGLRKLDRFIFSVERKGGLLSNRGVPERTIKKILEVDFPLYKTSEKDLTSSEKSLKNKVDKFYNVDRLLRRDERTPMLVVHEKGREPKRLGSLLVKGGEKLLSKVLPSAEEKLKTTNNILKNAPKDVKERIADKEKDVLKKQERTEIELLEAKTNTILKDPTIKSYERYLDLLLDDTLNNRDRKQEGGAMEDMNMPPEMMGMEDDMPIDTYPNIPPEEMAEAEASQLPDAEMEENYLSFVFDQSLDDEEQDYLTKALEADPKLSQILDKVVITASEFSGAGKVEGPGTGVSDSIPARLSDGEFVFTKKATDQIGAGNLQRMMDDAERAFDGGMMRESKRMGGMMMKDEDPDLMEAMSNEDINRQMLMSNRAPSLLGTN